MKALFIAVAFLLAVAPAAAQGLPAAHAIGLGKGPGTQGWGSLGPAAAGQLPIAQGASADPAFHALSGDCTLAASGVIDCFSSGMILPSTTAYWTNLSTPVANIVQLNDRVMIGKTSSLYDGYYFGEACPNWMCSPTIAGGQYSYLQTNAMLLGISTYGEMAATFASRTSDNNATPGGIATHGCCSMALAAVAVNDDTSLMQTAWGIYETTIRLPGTGGVINEYDIMNATSSVTSINPYNTATTTVSAGQYIQAGGEASENRANITGSISGTTLTVTATDATITPGNLQLYGVGVTALTTITSQLTGGAGSTGTYAITPSQTVGSEAMHVGHVEFNSAVSAAIVIGGNGSTFDKGIICNSFGISNSFPACLEMPANVAVRWPFDSGDATGGFITSSVSAAANANGMIFSDFGALLENPAKTQIYAQLGIVASAVNYPSLFPGATGNAVGLTASGGDTNIDLSLICKGTCNVVTANTIKAGGYLGRAGTSGVYSNTFNIAYTAAVPHLWIDTTDLGQIWTAPAGTVGVNCSGAPSGSFASVSGIVTHC